MLHTAVENFRRSCRAAERGERHQNGCSGLPHIVTSNVEHDSVKLAAEHLQRDGRAGGGEAADSSLVKPANPTFSLLFLSQM